MASPALAEDPPPFLLKWGSRGTLGGQFENAYDIAVDSQGNVYVTDGRNFTCLDHNPPPACPDDPLPNDRIQKFDPYGNFLAVWGWDVVTAGRPGDTPTGEFEVCTAAADCKAGARGGGEEQFSSPRGIALDSDDKVYVTDANNNRVQELTSSGGFVREWGGTGTGAGQFKHPRGVATDSASNVYVAEAENNRVQKFDRDGNFLAAWGWDVVHDGDPDPVTGFQVCTREVSGACKAGVKGSGAGQFDSPFGIAVDSDDNVYVTESGNHRVQKFTSEGTFITKWGSYGSGDGQFNEPRDIAFDSTGNIFIVDGRNYRVQKLTAAGTFITKWGSRGSGDGQFGLDDGNPDHHPYGIAIGPSGDIYVADTWNRGIQKFGPALAIAPTSHDFGNQAIDAGPSAPQTFAVTNTGGEDLTIDRVELIVTSGGDGEFKLAAETCSGQKLAPPTVDPAASCTVSVTFDPASTGAKQAALYVSHDAAGGPNEVALRGTGTDAALPPTPTPSAPISSPPPVAPALPPPAYIGVEVIVAKKRVNVRKGEAAGIAVACPMLRSQACQGRIEAKAKSPGEKHRGPAVVVGAARYGVLPGVKAGIEMKLSRAGMRLLRTRRRAGRLPVALTAESSVAGAPAIAPTKTVLLLKGNGKTR